MKLTNYKRGYNNLFDCSIHGTIYMDRYEYDDIVRFLYNHENELYISKDVLNDDLARRIITPKGFLINIRTTATGLIAEHYGLDNYKQGNYQLYITN